jgi:hypothetical protein
MGEYAMCDQFLLTFILIYLLTVLAVERILRAKK